MTSPLGRIGYTSHLWFDDRWLGDDYPCYSGHMWKITVSEEVMQIGLLAVS
jgi:hypothetical protein